MSNGRKRRFGSAGIANLIITNLVLQALLLVPAIPAAICTLASQAVNGSLGYAIYRGWVFEARSTAHLHSLPRYLALLGALWLANYALISAGSLLEIPRNLMALLVVPLLALGSYLIQKNWVFGPSTRMDQVSSIASSPRSSAAALPDPQGPYR